ncbi:MAG: hypothetical protein WBQ86_02465 [Candidatus Binatus sp.]
MVATGRKTRIGDMQNYVFFDTRPAVTWPYPIWNALNATTSKTLRKAWSKPDSRVLGDLAIALATKLMILGTVVGRFNSDYKRLLKLADDDAGMIKINRNTGTVWSLSDDRLTYELLAGIDAFIFEARSTYEILGKFLVTFCRIIFAQALTEEEVKNILRDRGVDVAWMTQLRDDRVLFFHETAPWLALMFHDTESASPELLIVRGNVKTLDDPNSFTSLPEYNRIYTGLASALDKLQEYLVARISQYEKAGAPN